ncbi:MAG: hypothetical protein KDA73_14505 [Rhodobacteraceae bacterium]|nr:hypothetical protein [Paracoccaceae bacterium]
MVDIFSRSGSPRPQDEGAQRLIGENRQTIERLADQISGGGYSRARAADAERRKKPVPAGLMIHDLGAGRAETAPKPYIRVSPNNRVVVVDGETGRQMHFLGELRRLDGRRCFVLATRENRFFSPVEDGIGAVLADLDGREIAGSSAAERELAAEIAQRLGLD